MSPKRTVLSGIQPTNQLHLGNYLGAIRNWTTMQEEYDCFFMMVDLHAITVPQEPSSLLESCYFGIASYLAAGLDPNKVTLFLQSHVPAHAELGWLLTTLSYMGELSRMTQYKDKSAKQGTNIGAGLFVYPCLMAADILLYQPHFVPVGEDQKQHIELTRNLAERFNNRYGKKIFTVPHPFIGEKGARIMDLQNPTNKMSKSAANPKGTLFLTDTDKQLSQKVKSAVTDSGSEITTYEAASSGLKNLLDLFSVMAGQSLEEVMGQFSGKTYGVLKVALAEEMVARLAPIREETLKLVADKSYLQGILKRGAERANEVAHKTLTTVYETIGFVPR